MCIYDENWKHHKLDREKLERKTQSFGYEVNYTEFEKGDVTSDVLIEALDDFQRENFELLKL